MSRIRVLAAIAAAALASTCLAPARATSWVNPTTTQSFSQYLASVGMKQIAFYGFGTDATRGINNLADLGNTFAPVGIAGYTTINEEWERYQPFNSTNFAFRANKLNITATLAGGLYAGGIASGQIWTKATYAPGNSGANVYAFQATAQIPRGKGMWSAFWIYSHLGSGSDASETDIAEFQDMDTQNTYDWTGYDHGGANKSTTFTRRQNKWVWKPGYDFAAGYHDYELIWTPTGTFKYVDGLLINAANFTWTSQQAGQVGLNLAVGSSAPGTDGLQPTSAAEFPAVLSIDHLAIWAK